MRSRPGQKVMEGALRRVLSPTSSFSTRFIVFFSPISEISPHRMVKFGTYDVCVAVDNEQLPEFDVVVEEEERKVTCWIPSEAGKVLYSALV